MGWQIALTGLVSMLGIFGYLAIIKKATGFHAFIVIGALSSSVMAIPIGLIIQIWQ